MFGTVTLEMSLKPFKKVDDMSILEVCTRVFEQWHPLIKNRKAISIMLWVSDGSEILDYTGELDKEFEWSYFVGTANLPLVGDLPVETSLNQRKQYYMDPPPKMTYYTLQKIVATLKAEGMRRYPNATIQIGAIFDIGPEFAISDFKYHRHPECCSGSKHNGFGFVDTTALLRGDDYPYAAYPNGLPNNTYMGTLLGAQANIFLKDMGYDYIWFSNGIGFSYEPWVEKGKIFDGEKFYPEKLQDTKEKILLFWKLFRAACPDFPVKTRGTNFSVGIDYACDGVPLYDIYNANLNITPPPNSPWAALNDDFGIEVLGHLTRNCMLPGVDYMFRYYLHDIWWMKSPWYDSYEGNPHDIYIPLALSRVDEKGVVQNPTMLNLLSIDNSMGDMPDICVNEVIPHLLKAEKDSPDEVGPVVLVYPMREYTTSNDAQLLKEMYFGDRFLRDAINNSFPLSTVVSTDNFEKHSLDLYQKSILIVPAAFDNEPLRNKLAKYATDGGRIIVYGSKGALETICYPCLKVDIKKSVRHLIDALTVFGYAFRFKKEAASPMPTIMLHRSDNAMFINAYNRDTTVETRLKFPLGAPIINGFDTKLVDGYAIYHFSRSMHGECRVFVKQDKGIVRAREMPPANKKYRRKIRVTGLEHAEVCFFAEKYCEAATIAAVLNNNRYTPVAEKNWEIVRNKENGVYLYGKNISGAITFCMPFAEYIEK